MTACCGLSIRYADLLLRVTSLGYTNFGYVAIQGDVFQEDTESEFTYTQHHTEGNKMTTTHKLLSSRRDDPPEWAKHFRKS